MQIKLQSDVCRGELSLEDQSETILRIKGAEKEVQALSCRQGAAAWRKGEVILMALGRADIGKK